MPMPITDCSEEERVAINTQAIAYRDRDTELAGKLPWDAERADKRPGILVGHGGAGLDSHAKGRARRLAELGFVVFACDMYGNGVAGNRERVMSRIAEVRDDTAKLCQRAGAGIAVLASHPQVDGRHVAAGVCLGGTVGPVPARTSIDVTAALTIHPSPHTP